MSLPRGQNSTPAEMIAELLRDAAVLVGVFAPLELYIITKQPLTWLSVLTILLLVLVLAAAGIVIEVKRS